MLRGLEGGSSGEGKKSLTPFGEKLVAALSEGIDDARGKRKSKEKSEQSTRYLKSIKLHIEKCTPEEIKLLQRVTKADIERIGIHDGDASRVADVLQKVFGYQVVETERNGEMRLLNAHGDFELKNKKGRTYAITVDDLKKSIEHARASAEALPVSETAVFYPDEEMFTHVEGIRLNQKKEELLKTVTDNEIENLDKGKRASTKIVKVLKDVFGCGIVRRQGKKQWIMQRSKDSTKFVVDPVVIKRAIRAVSDRVRTPEDASVVRSFENPLVPVEAEPLEKTSPPVPPEDPDAHVVGGRTIPMGDTFHAAHRELSDSTASLPALKAETSSDVPSSRGVDFDVTGGKEVEVAPIDFDVTGSETVSSEESVEELPVVQSDEVTLPPPEDPYGEAEHVTTDMAGVLRAREEILDEDADRLQLFENMSDDELIRLAFEKLGSAIRIDGKKVTLGSNTLGMGERVISKRALLEMLADVYEDEEDDEDHIPQETREHREENGVSEAQVLDTDPQEIVDTEVPYEYPYDALERGEIRDPYHPAIKHAIEEAAMPNKENDPVIAARIEAAKKFLNAAGYGTEFVALHKTNGIESTAQDPEIRLQNEYAIATRFEKEFGITRLDMERLPGYINLSREQKLLLFQNVKELNDAEKGKSVWNKTVSHIAHSWIGAEKTESVMGKGKGVEKYRAFLTRSIAAIKEHGPKVHEENGELLVDFAHIQFNREDRKEGYAAVRALNIAAHTLAKMPRSWQEDGVGTHVSEAGKIAAFFKRGFSERARNYEAYTKAQKAYDVARTELSRVLQDSGASLGSIALKLNQIDHRVFRLQLAQTDPLAVEAVTSIEDRSFWDGVGEKMQKYGSPFAIGLVSRAIVTQGLGALGGTALAAARGGFRARNQTEAMLRNADRNQRAGGESKELANVNAEIAALKNLKSPGFFARRKLKSLEARREALKGAELNVVSAESLSEKTERLTGKFYDVFQKDDLESRIERHKLLESLEGRIAYIVKKQQENRVNYGSGAEVPVQMDRLFQALGTARMIVATFPRDPEVEALVNGSRRKKNKLTEATESKPKQSALLRHLDRYLNTKEKMIDAHRRALLRGAVTRAVIRDSAISLAAMGMVDMMRNLEVGDFAGENIEKGKELYRGIVPPPEVDLSDFVPDPDLAELQANDPEIFSSESGASTFMQLPGEEIASEDALEDSSSSLASEALEENVEPPEVEGVDNGDSGTTLEENDVEAGQEVENSNPTETADAVDPAQSSEETAVTKTLLEKIETVNPKAAALIDAKGEYHIPKGDTLTGIMKKLSPHISELSTIEARENAIANILNSLKPEDLEYIGLRPGADIHHIYEGDTINIQALNEVIEEHERFLERAEVRFGDGTYERVTFAAPEENVPDTAPSETLEGNDEVPPSESDAPEATPLPDDAGQPFEDEAEPLPETENPKYEEPEDIPYPRDTEDEGIFTPDKEDVPHRPLFAAEVGNKYLQQMIMQESGIPRADLFSLGRIPAQELETIIGPDSTYHEGVKNSARKLLAMREAFRLLDPSLRPITSETTEKFITRGISKLGEEYSLSEIQEGMRAAARRLKFPSPITFA